MQRQERRRSNATRTRLTLENVQVSLTMMNYAKASYGCVFRKLWGAKTSRSARITRVSSCLQAHPKVTSYDDGHGTISWILIFAVVKDPALVCRHDKPSHAIHCRLSIASVAFSILQFRYFYSHLQLIETRLLKISFIMLAYNYVNIL